MVRRRVSVARAHWSTIDGVGPARCEKYGASFLEVLKAELAAEAGAMAEGPVREAYADRAGRRGRPGEPGRGHLSGGARQADRADVAAFLGRLDAGAGGPATAILDGSIAVGRGQTFRDPRPQAAKDLRAVLSRAGSPPRLDGAVGPVLDRTLVDDSFACRTGKGSLAAVQRAQHHVRRFPWYAKLDVRAYFASIDHAILLDRLDRVLKGERLLRSDRSDHRRPSKTSPGKGLPIGSLTSQFFANFYLGPLDRFLLEELRVDGTGSLHGRFLCSGPTRGSEAVQVAEAAASFLDEPPVADSEAAGPDQPERAGRHRLRVSRAARYVPALQRRRAAVPRRSPCCGEPPIERAAAMSSGSSGP